MKTKEFLKRWKVHLIFGGGFLIALALNVIINMLDGQRLLWATIDALREIKPFEYLMFVLFWYVLAHPRESTSPGMVTTLNLRDSGTEVRTHAAE